MRERVEPRIPCSLHPTRERPRHPIPAPRPCLPDPLCVFAVKTQGMSNKKGIKKLKEVAKRLVQGEVAARVEIWKQEFQVAKILAKYTRAKALVRVCV